MPPGNSYDAVIVLAGGVRDNGELPESTKQRVLHAQALLQSEVAPFLLFSGKWSWFRRGQPMTTEAEAMSRFAKASGIAAHQLLMESRSQNTLSNAFFTLTLFAEPYGWKRLAIITSDFHLPRTQYIFNKLYGPTYTIDYIAPPTQMLQRKVLHRVREKILLLFSKMQLGRFPDGDQALRAHLTKQLHS